MADPSDLICGIVQIANTVVGISIDQLSEVCHVDKLATLPVQSDLLLGWFQLRESIVPVLDFHKIGGLAQNNATTS